jgi:hypothetical protein
MKRAAMAEGGVTWQEEHLERTGGSLGGPLPRFLYDGIPIHLDDHLL